MRRAGLLVIVLLAIPGAAGQAKGKEQLPKFIQADNGLAAAALLRGGDYLTRVMMHFAGMDPPVTWVPFPKTADLIPAWMDEPVALPASISALDVPECGKGDYASLAAALKEPSPSPISAQPAGLIHLDGPSPFRPAIIDRDGRDIYGHSSDGCHLLEAARSP